MKKFFTQKNKGFAMLFTVLIVTLILTIALGISNTTLKQTILSSLAKDSQVAFYEADTAIECGMYYEGLDSFPLGSDPGSISPNIQCGNKEFVVDLGQSGTDYLVFSENNPTANAPCSTIVFDKRGLSDPDIYIVQGRGYNVCSVSSRQVERALEVRYDSTI